MSADIPALLIGGCYDFNIETVESILSDPHFQISITKHNLFSQPNFWSKNFTRCKNIALTKIGESVDADLFLDWVDVELFSKSELDQMYYSNLEISNLIEQCETAIQLAGCLNQRLVAAQNSKWWANIHRDNLFSAANFLTINKSAKAIILVRNPINCIDDLCKSGCGLNEAIVMWTLRAYIALQLKTQFKDRIYTLQEEAISLNRKQEIQNIKLFLADPCIDLTETEAKSINTFKLFDFQNTTELTGAQINYLVDSHWIEKSNADVYGVVISQTSSTREIANNFGYISETEETENLKLPKYNSTFYMTAFGRFAKQFFVQNWNSKLKLEFFIFHFPFIIYGQRIKAFKAIYRKSKYYLHIMFDIFKASKIGGFIKFLFVKYPILRRIYVGIIVFFKNYQKRRILRTRSIQAGLIKQSKESENTLSVKQKQEYHDNVATQLQEVLDLTHYHYDVAIAIAFTGRHMILKQVLDEIFEAQQKRIKLLVALVGTTREDHEFAISMKEKFNYIIYESVPNSPLGKKIQTSLDLIKKSNSDILLLNGSDDILTSNYIEHVVDIFRNEENKVDFVGVNEWYMLDVTTDSKYIGTIWNVFYKGVSVGKTLGAGRAYSRHFLEKINWKLFDKELDRGLDARGEYLLGKHNANRHNLNAHLTSVVSIKGDWDCLNPVDHIFKSRTVTSNYCEFVTQPALTEIRRIREKLLKV